MHKAFFGKYFLLHRKKDCPQNWKFINKNDLIFAWMDFNKNFEFVNGV